MSKRDSLVLFLLLSVMAVLYIKFSIVIPCFFKYITGLHCPGCGITRALISLLELDIYQAFRYNSVIFVDIPVIILIYILRNKYKGSIKYKKIEGIIIIILTILTILYGILRNIPYFSYLAPTLIR